MAAVAAATVPPEARELVAVATEQMRNPAHWSLWARLLLVVEEIDEALPSDLQDRILKLL